MKKRQLVSPVVPVACAFLLLAVCSLIDSGMAQMMTMSPQPTVTSTPIAGDSGVLIPFVVALVIVIVAVLIYYLYLKNKSKSQRRFSETVSQTAVTTQTSPSSAGYIEKVAKPFEVFLCYKKSSGKDYADHLKSGLEEIGFHTFQDCKDIPQTVDTEEGWACSRDKALEESKFFLLIMTPGFNLSKEVINEITLARKQANKKFVYFRHRSMGRNIVINLGEDTLDVGKLEQVSFETKEELLRLTHNILQKERKP
jgi:heme/copper-type cytochrome/quinol oxidase subunit 4